MKKWSILIPSVVNRPQLLDRLVSRLAPQVKEFDGGVEVVIFWNNYERQLGELRQLMLVDAQGEYVNFIDDDDLVVEDYVKTIFPLLDGVDYIGFMVDFYSNGTKVNKPVMHSLKCEGWYEDSNGFYRRGVHTNPIKRDIALAHANYDQSDYTSKRPEDVLYAKNIDPYLKTEHYIPRPLHIYEQTDNHAWARFESIDGQYDRPILPDYFRFHPLSTKGRK